MTKKHIPKANYSSGDTPLKIGEFTIDCYVLDNKQRVISRTGMLKGLGLSEGTGGRKGDDRLSSFVKGKRISKFISSELAAMIETPIVFLNQNNQKVSGYDASVLQKIIRGVSKAYLKGQLQKQQLHIGERAEILDDAFSETGLVALVDEHTGYLWAKERAKDELQSYFKKLVSDKAFNWVKTFPDEWFEMIFKMKGWTWNHTSRKPGVVGHYINNYVYSRLAPNVLDALRVKNPKRSKSGRPKKHHQYLTRDLGHPALKELLTVQIAFGRASGFSWDAWEAMVNKTYPKFGHTMEINFPELPESKPKRLSSFDKKMKKAIEFDYKKHSKEAGDKEI